MAIYDSIGSALVPGLLIPVVFSYFTKFKLSPNKTFLIMLFGCLTSTTCMVVGNIASKDEVVNYLFGIELMYVGFLLTIGDF
jgi:hypothetical protein